MILLDEILDQMLDHSAATDSLSLSGHSGPVYGVCFNPEKSVLLSGSEDGTGKQSSIPYPLK